MGLRQLLSSKKEISRTQLCVKSHLQGMNGIEIGKMIRSITEFVKTPFIIFSCENDPKIIKAAFKARSIVDDIYEFPFDLDKLRIRIEYLIEYYNTINDKKKPDSAFKEYKVPFLKRSFDIIVSFFCHSCFYLQYYYLLQ